MSGSPAISTMVTRLCNWGNFYSAEELADFPSGLLPNPIVTSGFLSSGASSTATSFLSGGAARTQYRGITYNSIRIVDLSNGGRGGYAVDPAQLKSQLLNLQKLNLVDRFDGIVNSFTMRPGRLASNGFFLVYKETLDEMSKKGSKSNSPNDYDTSLWEGEYRFMAPSRVSDIDNADIKITFSNKSDTTAQGHDFTSAVDADVTIAGVHIIQAVAITPARMDSYFLEGELASENDYNKQVFLIEVADPRAWASMAGVNQSYNVRTPNADPFNQQADLHQVTTADRRLGYNANVDYQSSPGTLYVTAAEGWGAKYYQNTMETGGITVEQPWSYQTLITDLWNKSVGTSEGSLNFDDAEFPGTDIAPTELGAYPIPAPPATGYYLPENFKFHGMSAWDAFWEVLDSISHTVILRQPIYPSTDVVWKIVSSNIF